MPSVDLSGIDLNLLVALDALLESGSVSGAARLLHRSQPAVSRMLARLRDTFGDPLLVPHGRGLAPTPRALAIRAPQRLLLSHANHLVCPPEPFNPATTAAHFRLVSSDYAQVTLMGSVVSWLARVAPRVTLEMLPVSEAAVNALAAGWADLLIGPAKLCPSWCEQERLLDDAWVVVRRRGEPVPATAEKYLALEHVAVAIELAFDNPVEAALHGEMGRARTVKLTVPDFAGALFVAATSPLVATLPRPVADAGAALLPLAVGRLPFTLAASSVRMIWPRRLAMEPAQVWFRQAVRQSFTLPEATRKRAKR
jgi:DNA-binding transcriptional LysR family regulator